MRVSLSEVSKMLSFKLPEVDKVVEKIGLQLGAVDEGVFDLSRKYKDAVIVKVVSAEKIEGSDHLSLCLIDDNNKVKVDRNKDGLIQVVCGAPNVRAGMHTVYLPPESIVPSTLDNEPFKLSIRPMLGHKSHGMLTSAKELDLGDDHNGIVELENVKAGTIFMEHYELDDVIVDIENKMFTHRPDCFGQIGVAREISGIFNKQFKSPNWYKDFRSPKQDDNNYPIEVVNEATDLVPRFVAVSVSGIEIAPSPLSLQVKLIKLGVRPINNIVDITNLVMLMTAQPMHAYDWDKVKSLSKDTAKLIVRKPKENEKITLLNSKTVTLNKDAVLIASDKASVGVGGVMGGANSEIDNSTKTIILESATFDMYSIRRTSMSLGLFSDAVSRFNKGQSPLQNLMALNYAISLIKEHIPSAKISSKTVDLNSLSSEVNRSFSLNPEVNISIEYINSRLGTKLSINQVIELLENVEFEVKKNRNGSINIKAPFYRTDIEIEEDIVEEVGRLYGFQNIEDKPIVAPILGTNPNHLYNLKKQIRNILISAGANDLLTYTFVSTKLITSASQDKAKAYKLSNAISPELEYYRLSVTPSLLTKVHPNIKSGNDKFAIFELGKYHLKDKLTDKIPEQFNSLAFVYSSKFEQKGAAYFRSVKYLDYLLRGITYDLIPFDQVKFNEALKEMTKPYEPSRSAGVLVEGKIIGIVGEFKASTIRELKLPYYTSGFEIRIEDLANKLESKSYVAKSKYPEIKQDITLNVKPDVTYSNISVALYDSLAQNLGEKESYFEIEYLGNFKKDSKNLNYTFRIRLGSYAKTMIEAEVSSLLEKVSKNLSKSLEAKRV